MLNYIWAGMILVAIITALWSGSPAVLATAAMEGAAAGVKLMLEMAGLLCFWSGLMEIASRAGLVRGLGRLLRPLTRRLFPQVPQESGAMQSIVMNMAANLLGLSNAATPLGLKAMGELDALNGARRRASDAMCMFVLINTASLQILPTTVILLRTNAGSAAPTEIIVPVWIVSVLTLTVGILSLRLLENRKRGRV